MELWFGTESFTLVTTQQSSAEYNKQTESYNIMVFYNITGVTPLCHTWTS